MFLRVFLGAASGSPGNQQYSIALGLTLSASAGERTITITQTPLTLVLAEDSQFSCYALQGTNFAVEFQGADVFNNEVPHFCI
jgi:hypothetical protein